MKSLAHRNCSDVCDFNDCDAHRGPLKSLAISETFSLRFKGAYGKSLAICDFELRFLSPELSAGFLAIWRHQRGNRQRLRCAIFRDAETTILINFAFWRGSRRGKIYGKLSKNTVFPSMTIKFGNFANSIGKRGSGQVQPRQGTEICNFGALSPLEALHWIFCFFSSIHVQFGKTSPTKSGESSEKSSGENRVKSCHVCGCHGFFSALRGTCRKVSEMDCLIRSEKTA